MSITADTGLSLDARKHRVMNALKLQPMTCNQLAKCICIELPLVQGAVMSLIADGEIKRVGITKKQRTVYSAKDEEVVQEHPLLISLRTRNYSAGLTICQTGNSASSSSTIVLSR